MSSFKGTPGPWSTPHFAVSNHGCDCRWVFSSEESGCLTIATINVAEGDENYEDPELEEAKYNALLISKAPDLASMLLLIISEFYSRGVISKETIQKSEQLIKDATIL